MPASLNPRSAIEFWIITSVLRLIWFLYFKIHFLLYFNFNIFLEYICSFFFKKFFKVILTKWKLVKKIAHTLLRPTPTQILFSFFFFNSFFYILSTFVGYLITNDSDTIYLVGPNKGVHTFLKSENECNNASVVRTRLLWGLSTTLKPLHHGDLLLVCLLKCHEMCVKLQDNMIKAFKKLNRLFEVKFYSGDNTFLEDLRN